ncbi:kinase-like domain-containing protein [Nemania abortiva]|nr:kinase-like domain-containing protein [Nemania abortiva]
MSNDFSYLEATMGARWLAAQIPKQERKKRKPSQSPPPPPPSVCSTQLWSPSRSEEPPDDEQLEGIRPPSPHSSDLASTQPGSVQVHRRYYKQSDSPTTGGGDQSAVLGLSIDPVEVCIGKNQTFDIDWDDLLHEDIWPLIMSSRILVHPKNTEVRILPYGGSERSEDWIQVSKPSYPTPARIFAPASGPQQVGCTIARNDTFGCFFFDTTASKVVFRNLSSTPFNLTKPGMTDLYYPIPNGESINVPAGIWVLETLGESLIEFQVMKRRAWSITQLLPPNHATPTKEDPPKRRRLSKAEEEALTETHEECINNPFLHLGEGETVHIDGMSEVKLLRTIYDNPRTCVSIVEHSSASGTDIRVVKTLKAGRRSTEELARSWMNECNIHSALDHPRIVKFLGADARFLSLYLEHIDTEALSDQIGPDLRFTGRRADALMIMKDIASALSKLHADGYVHGDIKPANVLYIPGGRATLIDLDLAHRHGNPHTAGCTSVYIPPEFMRNENLGPEADVWGFGLTMMWVLRRIPLPERTWPGFNIADIHKPPYFLFTTKEHSVDRMFETHERIESARLELNKDDDLESIIFETLERDLGTRIDTASLCERLDHIQLTDPESPVPNTPRHS